MKLTYNHLGTVKLDQELPNFKLMMVKWIYERRDNFRYDANIGEDVLDKVWKRVFGFECQEHGEQKLVFKLAEYEGVKVKMEVLPVFELRIDIQ